MLVVAGCLTVVSSAGAQASRTWVSGVGDDANPCSRTAPCKTFAGTISKTAAGGEIGVLDPGSFGAVTITKSITIDASGVPANITNTGVSGVTVIAADTDSVVLRGLSVNGITGAFCGYGGTSGIRVVNAGTVRIEDSDIGRQNKAIDVVPSTGPLNVLVDRVAIADTCATGVNVAPTGTGTAKVTVRASSIATSGTAVSVADGGAAWLTGNLLFANALGLSTTGTGEISDFGDNRYVANTGDGKPTHDLTPIAPTGPTGPTGATGATGATGPAGPQGEPGVKLLLARAAGTVTARTGRTAFVRYGATAGASTTVTVSRNGKRVGRFKTATHDGANVARVATKGFAAGKYTLTLDATGADGQTATTKVTLRLRRR